MIKAILLTCLVAAVSASPAYYGYSAPSKYNHAPGPKYSPPPKEEYIAHRPTYHAPSYARRPSYAPEAYTPSHAPSYAPSYAPAHYSAPKQSYAEPHYKPNPYSFGYEINDGYGTQSHQNEEGDDYGNKKGSYGYTDAYGLYRKVDYVADDYGFRAAISTNEPGTANASPASVNLYSSAAPAPAPYKEQSSYKAPAAYKAPAEYNSHSYSAPAPYHAQSYEPSYSVAHRQSYALAPKSGYGIYGPSYGGYSKQYFNMGYAKNSYEAPRY